MLKAALYHLRTGRDNGDGDSARVRLRTHGALHSTFLSTALRQIETAAMAIALACACVRLHTLYGRQQGNGFSGVGMLITFIVGDGFMLISVIALAVTQASQVRCLTPV